MSKQKENKIKEPHEKSESETINDIYQENDFDHLRVPPKTSMKTIMICLVLTIVLGLSAGFWGGLFILTSQKLTIPFLATWDFSEKLPKREITIQTQEEITITQDEHIGELVRQIKSQVVKIFPARNLEGVNVINQIHLDSQSVGRGFLLTNDGWLITTSEAIGTDNERVVVTIDNQMHRIEKIVRDPLTELAFVKLNSDNYDFPVAKFAEREGIIAGKKVLIFKDFETIEVTYISTTKYQDIKEDKDLVMSTERLQEFILLDKNFDKRLSGSAVFDLDGSVVGILRQSSLEKKESASDELIKTAISVNYLKNAMDQLLKYGEVRRPQAGIDYLDLSLASGVVNPLFKDYKKGVLLYGTPNLGTAAREAGLKNADVIIKVNNDFVNGRYNLTELIQEYLPGNEIEITFMRGQTEETVKIELGEM